MSLVFILYFFLWSYFYRQDHALYSNFIIFISNLYQNTLFYIKLKRLSGKKQRKEKHSLCNNRCYSCQFNYFLWIKLFMNQDRTSHLINNIKIVFSKIASRNYQCKLLLHKRYQTQFQKNKYTNFFLKKDIIAHFTLFYSLVDLIVLSSSSDISSLESSSSFLESSEGIDKSL